MPFIAQCPHCRSAKVQAPSRKQGTLHQCPKCSAMFPLEPWVESALPVEYKLPPVEFDLNEAYREPPAEDFASAPTMVHRPIDAATNATPSEVLPIPAPRPMPATVETDYTPDVRRLEPTMILAFAAGGIFGLAMILTQFPYGRLIAIPFLLVGLVIGLLAVPGLAERKNYGWAAVAVNVIGLVLVTLMPDWLGASTWLPQGDPNAGPKPVLAVNVDGSGTATGDVIDARKAVWRQDDVQFAVLNARVEPLDAKVKAPRKVLRITMKLTNVGVARAIPFNGWSGEASPKLTVANGPAVAFIKMESAAVTVMPGKDAEVVIAFEPPPAVADALMMELPGAAFEGKEPVKFRIPAAMITR